MDEKIFRKKSLDKIKSPENLDDYIKVSNPGIWLILVCVILLLIGSFVWGIFGHIDSTVSVSIKIKNGNAVCFVKEENIKDIKENMTVKFEGNEAAIEKIGKKEESGYSCPLVGEFSLTDGYYEGRITVKSYKPVSFILN